MTTTGEGTESELVPTPVTKAADLPAATVRRLPEYLRALSALTDAGVETVSSETLAATCGVNSAMLRKDLSQLGASGMRGVGYNAAALATHIAGVLGLTDDSRVAIIGLGHLGQALARYPGFSNRGFDVVGLFDADQGIIGKDLDGVRVRDVALLAEAVRDEGINIGVIATPEAAAQHVADLLVDAGVTSILNFAPCVLAVPEGVAVRKVDLAVELQILSFHEHHKTLGRQETGTVK
ncbi:redox-sensing transcriptional repressor Rex [Glycomyces buryatensis]|uniref:Redox-sensing transcriptional repressor Rex n=1 Tax=Glycomyces buryatensis TaxID=2570927 RepID=A0A4S8Q9X0_9ACTN|nr:redox-sensing transcriptional repressor Rex [Glycomyces buryatensis]THV41237.1 redox-sensing transcriptional repressor Rex [Glycomyces buryatensis]